MTDLTRTPPLCTRDEERRLLDTIREGSHPETGCAIVGLSYDHFKLWMLKGEGDSDGPYRAFYQRVLEADGLAEHEVIVSYRDAAKKDWRAAASFTGRRYPQRWAEQGPRREPGTGGITINIGLAMGGSTIDGALTEGRWTSVPELPDPDKPDKD